VRISGSDTLEPGDFFWLFFIGRPDQVSSVRTGGGKHTLELQAGYYIGRFPITIDIMCCRIIDVTAAGKYDPTHANGEILLLIIEFYGVGRAEFFTGPAFALFKKDAIFLVYSILEWDGLCIFYKGCLAFNQSCFIFVGDLFRAFFSTHAAGDTFVHINIARMLDKLDFKISLFPGYAFDFCEGE
jgi:hypothetical protein